MLISDFGLRIKDDELRDMVVKHLSKEGYKVSPDAINIVPLTNGKIEINIRQFQKKRLYPWGLFRLTSRR